MYRKFQTKKVLPSTPQKKSKKARARLPMMEFTSSPIAPTSPPPPPPTKQQKDPKPLTSSIETSRSAAHKKLTQALSLALAPRTTSNYNKSIKLYLKFAETIGVPENEALPCSDDMLCLFLAQGIGKTGPGNAKNLASGIRQWHVRQGLRWKTSGRVALIKKALLQCWPKREDQESVRPAVTPEMMKMLWEEWSDGSRKQLCALAMALAAWCGQMRLGELLPETARKVDRDRLPSRGKWSISSKKEGASTIELSWAKSTGFSKSTVHLLRQGDKRFNASLAMGEHLRSSQLGESALLCEYVDNRSKAVTLGKDEFMAMCNKIWRAQGINKITGHSFRIGGTTALLRAGVDTSVVRKMGRWESNAFLIYWRSLEEIFDAHASNIDWNTI